MRIRPRVVATGVASAGRVLLVALAVTLVAATAVTAQTPTGPEPATPTAVAQTPADETTDVQTPAEESPAAQTSSPQRRPAARPPASRGVFRAYFLYEGTEMMAANTFDAVLGQSRVYALGGGAEVLDLWNGIFARVTFSTARENGDRVVIVGGGDVVPLGIPLTVELLPLEIGGGWRSRPGAGGFVGYLGGSVLLMRYRETSQFGGDEDNVDEIFRGYSGFAGLEVGLGRLVVAGVEALYRTVPDAIGAGGVSQVFGESDLGGVTVRALVGVRY